MFAIKIKNIWNFSIWACAGESEKFNSNYTSTNIDNQFLINLPGSYSFNLDYKFLHWFVGFVDGEGNFHIRILDLKEDSFKSVQFIFQIGLHKDDIKVLEYIKNTIKCGHISKSGNRVNFFVNDINSLKNIILPIFDNINLNSSKFHHFQLFKKALLLAANKEHLTPSGA